MERQQRRQVEQERDYLRQLISSNACNSNKYCNQPDSSNSRNGSISTCTSGTSFSPPMNNGGHRITMQSLNVQSIQPMCNNNSISNNNQFQINHSRHHLTA